MSKRKRLKRLYTLIGYDEEGTEISRLEGITEEEAWIKKGDYARVSVFESGVVSPKVRCDIPDCGRISIARIKLERGGPIINVCRYHAAGVYIAPSQLLPVKGRLKYKGIVIAPLWLCIKYCPSYWEGECKAFGRPLTAKEQKKRVKGYTVYGERITVLCIEDDWWKLVAGIGGEKLLEELHL